MVAVLLVGGLQQSKELVGCMVCRHSSHKNASSSCHGLGHSSCWQQRTRVQDTLDPQAFIKNMFIDAKPMICLN
jgi:hypothetical protein